MGEYAERQASSVAADAGRHASRWSASSCLLLIDFGSPRAGTLVFLTLPFALVGAIAAVFLTGGVLSLGSLVGLVTVIGIAARNGIMLVSHYRHLELQEGVPFGRELILRGSEERLAPILMTAFATGLALVPIVIGGDAAGYEIEHPLAVVILGGLVTSTLMNLLIVPTLYLRFGRPAARKRHCKDAAAGAARFEDERAAVCFRNPSGNGQTESGTGVGGPEPDEPIEDALALRLRNAVAVVAHADRDARMMRD